MKMQLEQLRQKMLHLHLSDQQVYCLLKCYLYYIRRLTVYYIHIANPYIINQLPNTDVLSFQFNFENFINEMTPHISSIDIQTSRKLKGNQCGAPLHPTVPYCNCKWRSALKILTQYCIESPKNMGISPFFRIVHLYSHDNCMTLVFGDKIGPGRVPFNRRGLT